MRWLHECRLQLAVMRRPHGNAATPAVRNQENREKIPSTPWAYFTNGPNAAASIVPTLIRRWLQTYAANQLDGSENQRIHDEQDRCRQRTDGSHCKEADTTELRVHVPSTEPLCIHFLKVLWVGQEAEEGQGDDGKTI